MEDSLRIYRSRSISSFKPIKCTRPEISFRAAVKKGKDVDDFKA